MQSPHIALGQYYRSRCLPTAVRCKAYAQPPPDGEYITTIAPGTYLGPVEDWQFSERFATICVRGYWINVWTRRANGEGVHFATVEPDVEVQRWRKQGWED